jgi:hypothetical protein
MIRSALVAVTAFAVFSAHAPSPARVGVGATEFHLMLSRASVNAGKVVIELQNDGQDPHDLRLHRIGGRRTYRIPLTGPGRHADLQLKLLPGKYRLWCSVANHAQLGMQAVLRVRR